MVNISISFTLFQMFWDFFQKKNPLLCEYLLLNYFRAGLQTMNSPSFLYLRMYLFHFYSWKVFSLDKIVMLTILFGIFFKCCILFWPHCFIERSTFKWFVLLYIAHHFSLSDLKKFFFSFQQFDYDMSGPKFLYVYHVWD